MKHEPAPGVDYTDGSPRLDLDAYLDRIVTHGDTIMHLGCRLTPTGARIAAAKLRQLADELDPVTDETLLFQWRTVRAFLDGHVAGEDPLMALDALYDAAREAD